MAAESNNKNDQESGTTRRSFHLRSIYGLWALMAATVSSLSAIYLLRPARLEGSGEFLEAGRVADLPLSKPQEVSFRRNRVDGWKMVSEKSTAWVIKQSETELVAFVPYCTHLACAYHWEEKDQVFLCPCHTTTFSKDGEVLAGPAPRPLDRYEVKVDRGRLLLGPIQRPGEDNEA